MTQSSINDCMLSFTCSRAWDSLEGVSDESRFCDSCNMQVHAVRTIWDFDRHQKLGNCVAILRDDEQSVATVGMTALSYDTGRSTFDPILFRPLQVLKLPIQVEALLLASNFRTIGDLLGETGLAVAAILGSDHAALHPIEEALVSRGLVLGTKIVGWPSAK